MESMTSATPEDEFEIYFRKAATNKNITKVIRIEDDAESHSRRSSLPLTVRHIQIEEDDGLGPTTSTEAHHQRASSCKTTNKITLKPLQLSTSIRSASPKRHSQSDVHPPPPGNGFLCPLAAGDPTALSTSAPQSRSGSFRRASRPRSVRDFQEAYSDAQGAGGAVDRRRSSVNLEDTVAAKLQELKALEKDNCLVVRQFTTSSTGVIVDRIDSFKTRHSSQSRPSVGATAVEGGRTGNQLQVPGHVPGNSARLPIKLPRVISCEKAAKVLVLGDRRVGKTALVTQFMTSEYMAALDDSASYEGDTDNEKTISVSVDGEETMLHLIDMNPESEQEYRRLHPEVDCYLLTYSIADRKSFDYISTILQELGEINRTFAIIVVANKSDVVRKRQVPEAEVKDTCCQYSAKYIEVSAALNHRVDELLIGIVSQVRLNVKRRQRLEKGYPADEPPTPTAAPCSRGPRSFLSRLFSKKKDEPRPCDNLKAL